MADEQYRWLDRDAAERLLRGEPLEAVDAGTRDQVDRLAEALGALAAEPRLSSDELPGEAAALAAFRKARAGGGRSRGAAPATVARAPVRMPLTPVSYVLGAPPRTGAGRAGGAHPIRARRGPRRRDGRRGGRRGRNRSAADAVHP